VPKHSILSKSEKESLLKLHNISESQLPSINIKDPIAKILNAEVGNILKIEREGPSNEYLYFRRVVE